MWGAWVAGIGTELVGSLLVKTGSAGDTGVGFDLSGTGLNGPWILVRTLGGSKAP